MITRLMHLYISSLRGFTLMALCLGLLISFNANSATKPELYALKIYHLENQEQENRLEKYLQDAYLPALHRAGIKTVGVFKPAANPSATASGTAKKLVYVLVPHKSADQWLQLDNVLAKDKKYAQAGQDYINASFDKPPYQRMEVILMQAFPGKRKLSVPALKSGPTERVYELRNYEAATEKLHQNKIDMFLEGEMEIFDRLGFNPVFYAQVKTGDQLPNFMYMTSFENMAARDAGWKAFGSDPAWVKMSADPKYAHNFLRADIYLLHPTAYSDY